MNAQRNLGINTKSQSSSMEKLSSGLRINRAGDDAAGLAISEKMRNQISGLNQASRNAQDAISLIQTAEGALGETHEMLKRIRELAIQSANDTLTNSDRESIDIEVQQLLTEIDGIAQKTEFNDRNLLGGGALIPADVASLYAAQAHASSRLKSYVDREVTINLYYTSAAIILSADAVKSAYATITDLENTIGALEYKMAGLASASRGATLSTIAILQGSINDNNILIGEANAEAAVLIASGAELEKSLIAFQAINMKSAANNLQGITLTGKSPNEFAFHVGANQNQKINVNITEMTVDSLGLGTTRVDTMVGASIALSIVDVAIEMVSSQRATLGAVQNRLEHTISNVDNTAENLQAAESAIRDTDMPAEMVELTKYNILTQSAQAMLAQANQTPQQVLQLLS